MKCILPLIIALFVVNLAIAQNPNYTGSDIYQNGGIVTDLPYTGGTTGVNTHYYRINGAIYSHTNSTLTIQSLGTSGWLTQFNDIPTSGTAGTNIDSFLYQGYNKISGLGVAMFDYVHFNIGASNTMEIATNTPMYDGSHDFQSTPPGGFFVAKSLSFNNGITTTDRDKALEGAIVFVNSAGYTNTSGTSTDAQHVDGFVTEYNNANSSSGITGHNGLFTFPVGNASQTYPLTRSGTFSETEYMLTVAWIDGDPGTTMDHTGIYGPLTEDYDDHPVNAGTLTGGIAAVAAVGFWDWHFQSTADNNYTALGMSADQTITVSIPDLTAYTGSPAADLRLVGFNANTGKWMNLSASGATGVTKGSTLTGIIPAGTTITLLAIGSMSIILPVTFSDFTVKAEDCKALLEWKTAMEQNNNHFVVERSNDGIHFSAIAQVAAVGNSNTTQTYNYTDESPLTGINYYRITQVDFDGKYTSTAIRSIKINCTAGAGIVKAYPNPTSNQLYMQSAKVVAQVNILSSNGQNVLRFVPSTNQGGTFPINVQMLPGGIYLIQVVNKDGTADIIKMVKK
jgi:hypothetical protein